MPKMVHFDEFLKTWSLWSNRITRHVSFNSTKIGGKCQNLNIQTRHFGWFSNTVGKGEIFFLPFRIRYQFWLIVPHSFDRCFVHLEKFLFVYQQIGSKKEIRWIQSNHRRRIWNRIEHLKRRGKLKLRTYAMKILEFAWLSTLLTWN